MFATITNQNGAAEPASLADLKAQLATLSDEVSTMVANRARQASEIADAGVDAARETVNDYPLAAIAAAFAAGALVGLALTSRPTPTRRWIGQDVRSDLANYADELRGSLRNAARGTSMADNLERLSSALSAVDAKATVGPAVDRLLGWFNQAKAVAKDAMSKTGA